MVELLYLTLFAIMIWFALKDVKKRNKLTLYFFVVVSMAVLYILVPLGIFFLSNLTERNFGYIVNDVKNSNLEDRFICLIYVAIAFSSIEMARNIPRKENKLDIPCIISQSSASERVKNICFAWFYILFILGMMGIIVMIATLGLNGFIVYSGAGRGEHEMAIPSGSILAYGIKLAYFILASLVPGIILLNYKHNWVFKGLLIISAIFSLLILVFNAGKTQALLCLAPVVLFFLSKNNKIKIKLDKLILYGALIVLSVPLLDNIFYRVSTGTSLQAYRADWTLIDYMMSILKQFAYPYGNLLHLEEFIKLNGFRGGLDFLVIIVNSLPAFLLGGFQLDTQYQITTAFYQNVLQYGSGGQPNDLIFFCYTQLGVAGIIVICFIYGSIINGIDKRIQRISNCCYDSKIDLSFLALVAGMAGIVITLIEPNSVINSFPMSICALIMVYHLDYRLRRE